PRPAHTSPLSPSTPLFRSVRAPAPPRGVELGRHRVVDHAHRDLAALLERDQRRPDADAADEVPGPIDGTRNFVRGIGVWATLIALEERGEVTVGVIHNPVTAELYAARRGGGAYRSEERRGGGEGRGVCGPW